MFFSWWFLHMFLFSYENSIIWFIYCQGCIYFIFKFGLFIITYDKNSQIRTYYFILHNSFYYWLLLYSSLNNVYFEENKKITLLIYGEGNIINKKTYPPKSNFHKKLNKWLKTNSHGWHHSPASFAPSVYIISENISLNLRENSAVLNYKKSNDKYVQLITTINNSRFFDKLNKNILAH